jgi:exosortase
MLLRTQAAIPKTGLRHQIKALVSSDHVAAGLKVAALVGTTVALFSQDLTIVFMDALLSDTTSHILAIPLLVAYLVYRKRKMVKAAIQAKPNNPPTPRTYVTAIGILLMLTAILLYWHGSSTFTPLEYHLLALPLFVAALVLILFNLPTLRQLAFPIAFLLFLMPPPAEVLYTLGTTLAIVSAEASHALIRILGIPSTLTTGAYGNPAVLITRPLGDSILFTIDIACSGIFSLIGFLIFATFLVYVIRDKPWKRLTLFLIGIPLVYLVNIGRISSIILLGYHYGADIVVEAFHLLGGWVLIFFGTLLLLLVADKALKTQILPPPRAPCPACLQTPATNRTFCFTCGTITQPLTLTFQRRDALKITAILLVVIALLSVQAPTFALTQGSPLVVVETPAGQQVTTEILPQVSNYNLSFVTRDTEFERIAQQDMSLIYVYTPKNSSNELIWAMLEMASSRSSLHGWESCLITWPLTHGSQARAIQIESKDVQLTENPPIISRYFAFNMSYSNQPQAVLYWYETATFRVANATSQKHVKISLVSYPGSIASLPTIEAQLVSVGKAVASYWQPVKLWSQITMLIAQNGIYLLVLSSSLIGAVTAFCIFQRRRRFTLNSKAYRKLSPSSRQLITAVKQAQAKGLSTLPNILAEHQQTVGRTISEEELLEQLQALENMGLIASRIANEADEPRQTWRTQTNTGGKSYK